MEGVGRGGEEEDREVPGIAFEDYVEVAMVGDKAAAEKEVWAPVGEGFEAGEK